jgi:hypothetical protein
VEAQKTCRIRPLDADAVRQRKCRNRNALAQLICPTSKAREFLSSPSRKKFSTSVFRKHVLIRASWPGKRGGSRVVTNVGQDAMDAKATRTSSRADQRRFGGRRSRVVLTPRAGVKLADLSAGDGGKKARFPGESTKDTVKTIAQGMPEADPAEPVVPSPCFFTARGPWVRPSPGMPCALLMSGGTMFLHHSGATARRERGLIFRKAV